MLDKAINAAATALHKLLTFVWRVRRPRTFGAHALALTPERRVILVRLRYAPGWRLPGGGRGEHEDPRDAVLRELREEIGMTGHGRVRLACELEEATNGKRDLASLCVVEGVRYRPARWSWEIADITEAGVDDLPADLAPVAARWIEATRDKL